jgi:hypothetical protein
MDGPIRCPSLTLEREDLPFDSLYAHFKFSSFSYLYYLTHFPNRSICSSFTELLPFVRFCLSSPSPFLYYTVCESLFLCFGGILELYTYNAMNGTIRRNIGQQMTAQTKLRIRHDTSKITTLWSEARSNQCLEAAQIKFLKRLLGYKTGPRKENCKSKHDGRQTWSSRKMETTCTNHAGKYITKMNSVDNQTRNGKINRCRPRKIWKDQILGESWGNRLYKPKTQLVLAEEQNITKLSWFRYSWEKNIKMYLK